MSEREQLRLNMVIPPAPWTQALASGRIRIPDLVYTCNTAIDNAPDRFIATHEASADVGENGVRRLAIDRLSGKPAVGLPVWFGRELMQRNLIVRADSSLTSPADLAGKRVGSRLSVQSGTGAAVLMVLELVFDLDLRSVTWVMGDPASLPENRMGLRMERASASTDEEQFAQLLRGDLDAVMVTTGPRYWSLFGPDGVDGALAKTPGLRRLITDPTVMAGAYRRTRLYPISDLAVFKPAVAARAALAGRKLVRAFSEANALAAEYRPPEEQKLAEREIELLGDDPHQYGMTPDARKNLAAFLDFLYRLGAIKANLPPEELLEPSVR
jgi:4,5-dihydroxyphthalate decarboxylase